MFQGPSLSPSLMIPIIRDEEIFSIQTSARLLAILTELASDIYLEGAHFKFQLGHQLSWLRLFMIFIRYSQAGASI
jgi:hypothetical protein